MGLGGWWAAADSRWGCGEAAPIAPNALPVVAGGGRDARDAGVAAEGWRERRVTEGEKAGKRGRERGGQVTRRRGYFAARDVCHVARRRLAIPVTCPPAVRCD